MNNGEERLEIFCDWLSRMAEALLLRTHSIWRWEKVFGVIRINLVFAKSSPTGLCLTTSSFVNLNELHGKIICAEKLYTNSKWKKKTFFLLWWYLISLSSLETETNQLNYQIWLWFDKRECWCLKWRTHESVWNSEMIFNQVFPARNVVSELNKERYKDIKWNLCFGL